MHSGWLKRRQRNSDPFERLLDLICSSPKYLWRKGRIFAVSLVNNSNQFIPSEDPKVCQRQMFLKSEGPFGGLGLEEARTFGEKATVQPAELLRWQDHQLMKCLKGPRSIDPTVQARVIHSTQPRSG